MYTTKPWESQPASYVPGGLPSDQTNEHWRGSAGGRLRSLRGCVRYPKRSMTSLHFLQRSRKQHRRSHRLHWRWTRSSTYSSVTVENAADGWIYTWPGTSTAKRTAASVRGENSAVELRGSHRSPDVSHTEDSCTHRHPDHRSAVLTVKADRRRSSPSSPLRSSLSRESYREFTLLSEDRRSRPTMLDTDLSSTQCS